MTYVNPDTGKPYVLITVPDGGTQSLQAENSVNVIVDNGMSKVAM